MYYLPLSLLLLAGGLALLLYEAVTGEAIFRIRGLNFNSGWFLLGLALFNFARWYASRVGRAEQEALRIAHEARLRQARHRERPAEPDPTFDFSDRPAEPPGRDLTGQPPSSN